MYQYQLGNLCVVTSQYAWFWESKGIWKVELTPAQPTSSEKQAFTKQISEDHQLYVSLMHFWDKKPVDLFVIAVEDISLFYVCVKFRSAKDFDIGQR